MQQIQDFIAKNKIVVAGVAIIGALGLGAAIINQKDKNQILSSSQLDPSITQVSLHNRLGGDMSVNYALNRFFDLIWNDKQFKDHFLGKNKESLKKPFVAYMSAVFGGSQEYEGKPLKEVHAPLQMNAEQFEIVKKYLKKSLEELGIDQREVKDAQEVLDSIKDQFITQQ